ncbi:MAG: cell envelope integrity protein TolA [Gammaproteobacteria bacterium]|nr:cell envelope integrity protein TolA [Gammaproteobacteria bacterium]
MSASAIESKTAKDVADITPSQFSHALAVSGTPAPVIAAISPLAPSSSSHLAAASTDEEKKLHALEAALHRCNYGHSDTDEGYYAKRLQVFEEYLAATAAIGIIPKNLQKMTLSFNVDRVSILLHWRISSRHEWDVTPDEIDPIEKKLNEIENSLKQTPQSTYIKITIASMHSFIASLTIRAILNPFTPPNTKESLCASFLQHIKTSDALLNSIFSKDAIDDSVLVLVASGYRALYNTLQYYFNGRNLINDQSALKYMSDEISPKYSYELFEKINIVNLQQKSKQVLKNEEKISGVLKFIRGELKKAQGTVCRITYDGQDPGDSKKFLAAMEVVKNALISSSKKIRPIDTILGEKIATESNSTILDCSIFLAECMRWCGHAAPHDFDLKDFAPMLLTFHPEDAKGDKKVLVGASNYLKFSELQILMHEQLLARDAKTYSGQVYNFAANEIKLLSGSAGQNNNSLALEAQYYYLMAISQSTNQDTYSTLISKAATKLHAIDFKSLGCDERIHRMHRLDLAVNLRLGFICSPQEALAQAAIKCFEKVEEILTWFKHDSAGVDSTFKLFSEWRDIECAMATLKNKRDEEREAKEKEEKAAKEKKAEEAKEKAAQERAAKEKLDREIKEKAAKEMEAKEKQAREAREKAAKEREAKEKQDRETKEKIENAEKQINAYDAKDLKLSDAECKKCYAEVIENLVQLAKLHANPEINNTIKTLLVLAYYCEAKSYANQAEQAADEADDAEKETKIKAARASAASAMSFFSEVKSFPKSLPHINKTLLAEAKKDIGDKKFDGKLEAIQQKLPRQANVVVDMPAYNINA